MKINFFIALFLLVSTSVSHAALRCEAETWIQEPKVTNGLYSAQLGSVCWVTAENGGGFAALAEYMVTETMKEEVIEGPIAENFENLPSTYFDVRARRSSVRDGWMGIIDERDTLTVRSDVHIATNDTTLLIQEARSKEISGTGNLSYVRKIDFGVRATPTPGDVGIGAVYRVEVWNVLNVKKPAVVPTGMFRDQVSRSQKDEFIKSRDMQLAPFAKYL